MLLKYGFTFIYSVGHFIRDFNINLSLCFVIIVFQVLSFYLVSPSVIAYYIYMGVCVPLASI